MLSNSLLKFSPFTKIDLFFLLTFTNSNFSFEFLYSSIIKPTCSKLLGKALSEYLHKKLWNSFSNFIYLDRVSLLIFKPNPLKYSIHNVNESNFKVWLQESINIFPFLTSNSTGILLRVPKTSFLLHNF